MIIDYSVEDECKNEDTFDTCYQFGKCDRVL